MESASYSGGRSVTLGLTDVLASLQTDLDRTRNRTEHSNNRPVDPDDRSLGQKIDQLLSLCMDNKSTIEAIQRDSEATKQEISSIKAQIVQNEQNQGNDGRKKRIVPTVLSVSVKI